MQYLMHACHIWRSKFVEDRENVKFEHWDEHNKESEVMEICNIDCTDESKLYLEFDLFAMGIFLKEFEVWSPIYMKQEINYFDNLPQYAKFCLDSVRIYKLISDISLYNDNNCDFMEIVQKFINYKWVIHCLALCWKCGDMTYCKKCNVRLHCSCASALCTGLFWKEHQVSMTNDLPNCWCVDCHILCCWNRSLCTSEINIV